jgi:hypothetical protein
VAGAFPEAAQFVLSAQQLMSSSITPELAAGLRSVLVYGADLQAFDVLATLIGTGVDAGESTAFRCGGVIMHYAWIVGQGCHKRTCPVCHQLAVKKV